MKFPGRRKSKHYFPVTEKMNQPDLPELQEKPVKGQAYIVGIDELLVDIEIKLTDDVLLSLGLTKGQSALIPDDKAQEIYERMKKEKAIIGEFAGGAIGNTIHNYTILADDKAYLLGAMPKQITVGDYAFKYLCHTSTLVDLNYLEPSEKAMGRAMCFITPDGERTFGISRGCAQDLSPAFIPEEVIAKSSALVISVFHLRNQNSLLFHAVMKAIEYAKKANVPVALSLGTSSLVAELRDFLQDFVQKHISILAMNREESFAFTGEKDLLLAGSRCLDFTDMALITDGEKGLYLCAHVDEACARKTRHELHSKSIPEYNRYEFSRAMAKVDCKNPIKFFSHINPYLGGPKSIRNTNGAGDAAFAALLHDIVANHYHRLTVPNSAKHQAKFLTYSSLSQISKYANRVSYEVLIQNSARLSHGLPPREDNLEDSYWDL